MPSPFRIALRLLAAALIVAGVGFVATVRLLPVLTAPAPGASTGSQGADPLEAEVAQLVAKLAPPRTFEFTAAKASRAVAAIKRGNEAAAVQTLQESLAATPSPGLTFTPYEMLIRDMSRPHDTALLDRLGAWAARDPGSPWPTLLRAQTNLDLGWLIRGDKTFDRTRADHGLEFEDYMRLAQTDIEHSLVRNGRIPFSWFQLLNILQGGGDTAAMEAAFQHAIAQFPEYYPLYRLRLLTLEPRWGGSIARMYGFVARYADTAPAASPLKMLYLNLYSGLLTDAARNCWAQDQEKGPLCVAAAMGRRVTPDLETKLRAAFALYGTADRFGFAVALRRVLTDMLNARSGQAYLGAVLQLAADATGSSNQLKQENPGHSFYLLDEISGAVWRDGASWENAETKYLQALRDLDAAPFADPELNAFARAEIYDGLALTYKGSAQFAKVLAYRNAAVALAGDANADLRYLQCYAYWRLKRYDDANRVCAQEVAATNDVPTRFWLGKVQAARGDTDSAARNLQAVAETESFYRISAAIDLSVVYGDRHDYQTMLDSLNSHGFLFDPDAVSKQELAISFNNRCYALMKLQQYEKALADCTMSLKFGSLPDAFQKEQELIKLLKNSQEPL
jgi:hypothetical protein